MGLPLEARPDEKIPAPAIRGFRARVRSRVAVLLSHGHPDHYGLIGTVPSDVPVYLGEATQRIVREAQFFSPIGADIDAAGHLRDRQPIKFGPFTITRSDVAGTSKSSREEEADLPHALTWLRNRAIIEVLVGADGAWEVAIFAGDRGVEVVAELEGALTWRPFPSPQLRKGPAVTGDLHPTVDRTWCEWSRVGFDTASSADHDLLRWLPLITDAAN